MTIEYKPSPPDKQNVRLRCMGEHVDLDQWTGYEFARDMLTPSDSFSFDMGGALEEKQRRGLKLGERVRPYINNMCLAEGYIDSVEINADRGGGLSYAITGRDRLGQTLDTVADPTFQLPENGTLGDFLRRLFGPFGWTNEEHFDLDNSANRAATAGARGLKLSKAKKQFGQELKDKKLHQTKPYNHESIFHFASRVAQRHGLWIWPSVDGEKLIVSAPDYNQDPVFTLRRDRAGNGNILSGAVRYDMSDQPAIIIADGFSGGGEFGKSRIKAYAVNPILGLTDEGEHTADVKALLKRFPDAVESTLPAASFAFRATNIPFRPMFLHDDESKSQEQLNAFVKREMSLMLRKALTCHYTVEGHGMEVDGQFSAWTPDTIVDVRDYAAELKESMYVLGVHYSKRRGGTGTTTRLDLVRKHSIVFDATSASPTKASGGQAAETELDRAAAQANAVLNRILNSGRGNSR